MKEEKRESIRQRNCKEVPGEQLQWLLSPIYHLCALSRITIVGSSGTGYDDNNPDRVIVRYRKPRAAESAMQSGHSSTRSQSTVLLHPEVLIQLQV